MRQQQTRHFCCGPCWRERYEAQLQQIPLDGIETCCICGNEIRSAVIFYAGDFNKLVPTCIEGEPVIDADDVKPDGPYIRGTSAIGDLLTKGGESIGN